MNFEREIELLPSDCGMRCQAIVRLIAYHHPIKEVPVMREVACGLPAIVRFSFTGQRYWHYCPACWRKSRQRFDPTVEELTQFQSTSLFLSQL